MKNNSLLLLYEEKHADLAVPGVRIACFNFWLERELKSRGFTPLSLGNYLPDEMRIGKVTTAIHIAARDWYRIPVMQFFEHKCIRIGEALEPMVSIYLGRLAYWRYSFGRILDSVPEITEIVIPQNQTGVFSTSGPLALFEVRVAVDAARSIALERGLVFRVLGDAPQPPVQHLFPHSRLQNIAVAFYNACISLAPKRSLKIYASEYWRNVAPFIKNMDDVELELMDRNEFFNIPWWQLWKHRVRFVHPSAVARDTYHDVAQSATERFRAEWSTAKKMLAEWDGWTGADISWTIVDPALTYLVEIYAERIVADIERFEYLLVREEPNKILQRASLGGRQPHFFLLAHIARRLGIPSIELQHAGAYVDPRSAYSRLETDYLASYGQYENEWYERNGYAQERMVSIGSPRFDRCIMERTQSKLNGRRLLHEAGLDPERPVLVAAVPDEGIGFNLDSFMLKDFFSAVAGVHTRIPELQVVFKFRPGHRASAPRMFAQEIIPGAVCMAREDLFSLVCASDIVVCGNSTVIYETLLGQKPLVLHPWTAYDTYHAEMYTSAAPIVYDANELSMIIDRILTDDVYKKELISRGQRFLQGYSFDGKSSERMAALLRSNLVVSRSAIVSV